MNIDKETLAKYRGEKSAFAKKLNSGINFKKAVFKADKSGRCAFLNDKNLCEIIINKGESSLCQVCRDHPKFRSFFGDRVELGLGFCCEQATKIILSFDKKIQPLIENDDKKDCELDFREKNIIQFRERALSIIQDRGQNIGDRIQKLLALCNANILEEDYKRAIKLFLSFERLDKGWTKRLKSIKRTPFAIGIEENLSIYAEQFLVNGIYRHLWCAEDTMWVRANLIGCILSWQIIYAIIKSECIGDVNFGVVVDVVRAYSAEVEYSQKNLDKLFSFAFKLIKV